MNILEWSGGQPLAIDPGCLDALSASLEGADMLSGKAGTRSESHRILSVRDGVAEIAAKAAPAGGPPKPKSGGGK